MLCLWRGCVRFVIWEGAKPPSQGTNERKLVFPRGVRSFCVLELRAFCALGRVEVFFMLRQYSQTPNRKTNPELAPGFLR